ncbi:unnamed protein product [Cylicocyclus nassatus]|uniref:Uncharacterized protein n=1 Tax=Cylicocyclus nassatus TaxID=53992 RepID=A0AA36M701_CYLNA|nr:unnamed protein product [Cylicocyclus nassatus]
MNLSLLLLPLGFCGVYGGLCISRPKEEEYWMCAPRIETCLKISNPRSLGVKHYTERSICEGKCKSRVASSIELQI